MQTDKQQHWMCILEPHAGALLSLLCQEGATAGERGIGVWLPAGPLQAALFFMGSGWQPAGLGESGR